MPYSAGCPHHLAAALPAPAVLLLAALSLSVLLLLAALSLSLSLAVLLLAALALSVLRLCHFRYFVTTYICYSATSTSFFVSVHVRNCL